MKFFSTALFGIGMNRDPFATTHKIYFSYFYTEKISKKKKKNSFSFLERVFMIQLKNYLRSLTIHRYL